MQHGHATGIGLAAQGHARGRELVELVARIRVLVCRRALEMLQQVILRRPHQFAAARHARRPQKERRAKEMEQRIRRLCIGERERDAGADQVGQAKRGRDIVAALLQGDEPVVLFVPDKRGHRRLVSGRAQGRGEGTDGRQGGMHGRLLSGDRQLRRKRQRMESGYGRAACASADNGGVNRRISASGGGNWDELPFKKKLVTKFLEISEMGLRMNAFAIRCMGKPDRRQHGG